MNDILISEFLNVEVAFALPNRQLVLPVRVKKGTSIYDAAVQSDICNQFQGLELEGSEMGIFGKLERFPKQRLAQEGDRIEIYRPLKIDPKEGRRLRAKKAQSAAASDASAGTK